MEGAIARKELHGDEGILIGGHDNGIRGAKTAGRGKARTAEASQKG
jgi:hypothetical protein